jgi:serine/threonine-protein kinase
MSGAVVGTPGYASPEQLVGSKQVDHRADLWSLAVVAFKALTGELPFKGHSGIDLALAIRQSAPPKPSALRIDLPPSLDAWFAKGLAVAASDRFVSAQELAHAFALAAQGGLSANTIREPSPDVLPSFAETARLVVGPATTLPLAHPPMHASAEPTAAPATISIARPRRSALAPLGLALVVLGVVGGLFLYGSYAAAPASAPPIAVTAPPLESTPLPPPRTPETAALSVTPPPPASLVSRPSASIHPPRATTMPRATTKSKETAPPTPVVVSAAPEPNGKLF